MKRIRSRDRLDRRLRAGRLRGPHLRAVARALAKRGRPHGRLSCRTVFVGRRRRVRFDASTAKRGGEMPDDVIALARDLRRRGAPRRAEQLAAAYALAADDYGIFRALDAHHSQPLVIATGGRVASGKSTLAKAVARRLASPRVVADRVRERLLAEAPAGSGHELAWAPDFAEQVYAALLARANEVLASGRSVVLDACFPTAKRRREADALARRHGARFVFVHCDAPREQIAARLRLRDARQRGWSGGWKEIARAVEAQWQPPREHEPGRTLRIDTSLPRAAWLRALGLTREERA